MTLIIALGPVFVSRYLPTIIAERIVALATIAEGGLRVLANAAFEERIKAGIIEFKATAELAAEFKQSTSC